eukprot:CFRG0580T1
MSSLLKRREYQTEFEAEKGNALQACVATILNVPMNEVPNFIMEPDYWASMLSHAKTQQYTLIKVPLTAEGRLPFATGEGALCIVRGTSPRGSHGHVVVGAVATDGTRIDLIHDPFPNGGEPCLALQPTAVWAAFYVPCFFS